MSCCCQQPDPPSEPPREGSCCGGGAGRRVDYLLWGGVLIVAIAVLGHGFAPGAGGTWGAFAHSVTSLLGKIWWGVMLGIVAMAFLGAIPREFVIAALGRGEGLRSLLRAAAAGLLLDLCNHGILMVGAKLYERGASYGQILTFLIASPWNSLSLTLVLVALIGLPWTLAFIGLSLVVALATGMLAEHFTARGKLPTNPNRIELPADFRLLAEARGLFRDADKSPRAVFRALLAGVSDSRMVLRWLLLGVILAGLVQVLVPSEVFSRWFGPSLLGLALTLLAATAIEVCSEGSTPIAADLLTRAGAPGNSFTFLMAGAATDYTEVMVLKETTRRWRMALFLPLATVPQVVALGWLLNLAGG